MMTKLMVMSTSQARPHRVGGSQIQIRTPNEIIQQSECEKLLGGILHQDMKWSEHILEHEESLVRSLNSRLGAVKLVSKVASFRNRKMIANGIFLSKLTYLMPLWGGCSKGLVKTLQTIQNKAERAVTKLDWNTPTAVHLKQCGWLSVQQLIFYHSVLLVYKVLKTKSPKYLYDMFSTPYNYKTRQADDVKIRHEQKLKLDLAADGFRWRASGQFNLLPLSIRNIATFTKFKTAAKKWIRQNVDPG